LPARMTDAALIEAVTSARSPIMMLSLAMIAPAICPSIRLTPRS
jgi:hypothetical protein